jgi:hypothetical protein
MYPNTVSDTQLRALAKLVVGEASRREDIASKFRLQAFNQPRSHPFHA